ncbi:Hypothetical predicted protein [Mytilus galloprovincialis]|uniref:Uncharacterized protein n=1 Tax=Mytilus galloprovincialis TaxID=29158 RepID=A0A8B6GYK8_MYTGA|nr:Hypothetical predicted protein [Mytilus galloprovincialis]
MPRKQNKIDLSEEAVQAVFSLLERAECSIQQQQQLVTAIGKCQSRAIYEDSKSIGGKFKDDEYLESFSVTGLGHCEINMVKALGCRPHRPSIDVRICIH